MRTCPVCRQEKRLLKSGIKACSKKCETRKLTRQTIANIGGNNDPFDVRRSVRRTHPIVAFQGG